MQFLPKKWPTMIQYEDVEYLEDSKLEISCIDVEGEVDPLGESDDFVAANFDETRVNKDDEVMLTTFLELDESYENDRTLTHIHHCPLCKRAFLGRQAIKKHVQRYFKFSCETCEKKYFKIQYLKRHLKNAHLESRELECPVCSKKFRAVNNLKQHLYLHSDEKNFECQFCQRQFRQKPGLQQHIRRVHKKDQTYECPYCHELVDRLSKLAFLALTL